MISRTPLENGPVVVVDGESSAPVSAVYLWFRVGSALEPEPMAGAAHFLEHLLFKGAGHHGVGEAAARIEGLGGELNAYTAYEQTVLHATVPAGREEAALALLAEMACRPHLDAAEIDRERTVVIEELRGATDEAGQVLADALRARAYGAHPYGRPILGTEASLRAMDKDALSAFHARYYTPANAVLAIAGPVDPQEMVASARRHLGQPGERPARPTLAGVPPPRAQTLSLNADFEERLVELAFPVPGLAHPNMAALDLLVTALGDGEASLLSVALKGEQGLAVDTWAALENEPDAGLLIFGLSAREGKAAAAAESLAASLADVARHGIPTAALHRARTAVLSSRVYDRETADGRAHRLAWYEAFFSDPNQESAYEAEIMRVTPGDLRRAAASWLRPDRLIAGAVAPARQLGQARLARAISRGWERGPAVFGVGHGDGLRSSVLPCGARVVLLPDADAELAGVSVVGVGGVLVEGGTCPGLSDLWAATAGRGAGDLDAAAFSEAVEARAGSLSSWAWRNSTGFSATFPAGELSSGLDLLCAALLAPRFDLEEVDRARAELNEARKGAEDSPGDLAWDLAWQLLYPDHPWGRPSHGTAMGLRRATTRKLRRYHQQVFAGNNLVISLAGAVDPDRVLARLTRGLARMPAGEAVLWAPPPTPETWRVRRRLVPRQQTHLVFAFPGRGWGQPDAPALALAEAVLGGQGGRLFNGLRERRGLAYEVSASAEEGLGGGTFLCSLATDPLREEEAKAALWEELDALTAAPLERAELDRVRARLIDGAALDLQRASARAAHLAAAERYGPGAAQFRELLTAPGRVEADALQRVAAEVFKRDRGALVAVGPLP